MRILRAALVAVVALYTAGCSGGDDGTAQLAERADPICERANASLAALARPESLEQLLRYVDDATEVLEERRRDLRALAPPEGSEDEWTAFLAADDRTLAALARLRESTVTGRGGDEAIQAFETTAAEARERAESLGLEACAAEPPQPAEPESAPPPATTAAPATSTWAESADAICADAQGRIDALPQPTDPVSAAAQVAQIAVIVKAEIADLRELRPRQADRARVQRFLGALGRGANSLDRLEQAMRAEDEEAVDRFIGEGQTAATNAQREADALGLTVCGRG